MVCRESTRSQLLVCCRLLVWRHKLHCNAERLFGVQICIQWAGDSCSGLGLPAIQSSPEDSSVGAQHSGLSSTPLQPLQHCS